MEGDRSGILVVSFLCDLMKTMMITMMTTMKTMMMIKTMMIITMLMMMTKMMMTTMMMMMMSVADASSPFLISSLYLAFAHPQSPGSLLYFVILIILYPNYIII